MKFFIILFILNSFTNYLLGQAINQQNINNTCEVLSALTDTAVKNNRPDLVILYYQTFISISQLFSVDKVYREYFSLIVFKNKNIAGKWCMDLNSPPKPVNTNSFNNMNATIKELFEMKEYLKSKGIIKD
jgi:hypothetical protein